MRVLIAETEEVKELHYVCDGIDYASEIVGNYGNFHMIDCFTDATIMPKSEFEWWDDMFKTHAFYDNLIDDLEAL